MDVFEAVRTMRAVRRYKPDPIPDDVVQRILEAGRLTGSAGNRQPWHFVVVRDRETLERMSDIVITGRYVVDASLAIVVAIEKTRFSLSDASRAIQSMLLTAWSDGVGGNWAGGPGHLDGLRALLGIPDELDVVAVLPIGYPAVEVVADGKDRKPLGEVASRERYGRRFG
jgi:nitroreductase